MLTKDYFKKRQMLTVIVCGITAAIIGSIQTAYFVQRLKKGE